jgi:acetyl esterase/lipase
MNKSIAIGLVFAVTFLTNILFSDDGQRRQPRSKQKVRVMRDVEYGRAGDRSLKLDIYQPTKRNADALPAIVWIHGGGWRNGNKSSGARLTSFVATGKYVGVSVGYRLSGESLWPAQIHDCKAAIRWIRANAKEHGINPDRIGVWGSSAGGHLVSLLGTSSNIKDLAGSNGSPDASSRVKCVVDFCGPADMAVFKHARLDQLFGKPFEDRQTEAKAASPATYVTKDDPPILIVHGTNDRTVPIAQAELFHVKLNKAGVDVTFVKIQGGGHGISGKEVINRVNLFFAKHLRDEDVEVSGASIKAAAK